MSSKSNIIDDLATIVEADSIRKPKLEDFADLEYGEQLEVIDLIKKAFKNVFKIQIENKEIITLPNVAKLRIKNNNAIALKHKDNIANELGYNRYDLIPDDKLKEVNDRVRKLTIEDIKNNKLKKNINNMPFNTKNI